MSEEEYTGSIEDSDSQNYESIDGGESPKKKLKVPALIVGIIMIVAGGIGIALLIPQLF